MEFYKKLIAGGIILILLTTFSSCAGLPPVLSGLFLVSGVISMTAGIIKGKKDFLKSSAEMKMLTEGMERESKIRLVITTIGCTRDDAIRFLEEYDWDEIKIFLDFKKFPERFYGEKKAMSDYNYDFPPSTSLSPYVNPITMSNCPSCGNMCPENLACCPACKAPLHGLEKINSIPFYPAPEDGKRCSSCQNICPAGLNYCPQCEADLRDMAKKTVPIVQEERAISSIRCPDCGNLCSSGLAYCTECGFKL